MADLDVNDLRAVDREVARAASSLAQWRAGLAVDPAGFADADPFIDTACRRVATGSFWTALAALPVSGPDAVLRDALKQWAYALLQARIGCANELAWARQSATPTGRFEGERPRLVTWREAWRGVVVARTPVEARLWLNAAADEAPHLAEISRARAARSVEVARRLGLAHPWEPLVNVARVAIRAAAARLLDATEDLSRFVWTEAVPGKVDAAAVIHAAVARGASEGWPARLVPRWMAQTLGTIADGLPIQLPGLPSAIGAASFARAFCTFGYALHLAAVPSSMPFALAREPAFVGAHRLAFVFGALPAHLELYVHALGVGRRTALAQARLLARTALLDARLHAARILLGDPEALAPRELFEEVGVRLFQSGLDERLRGAWPAARHDEPARLVGLLGARALRDGLRDRFDADWFRNPRAGVYIRTLSSLPAHEVTEPSTLLASADALAREFEEALG